MAQDYFDYWLPLADHAQSLYRTSVENGVLRDAAFMLHQATERLYICFLLVRTLYFPRSHNIKFLRSLSEDKEPRLVDAWPRASRVDRSRFERLKRAYVEARYSTSYAITNEDLDALAASIERLRAVVVEVSEERLAELQSQAGA